MNKRGFGFISITGVFILVLVAMVLINVQTNPDFGKKEIDSITQTLNWENYSFSNKLSNYTNGNYYHDVIITGIFKTVDLLGWLTFETAKIAMSFAFDNPNLINGQVLLFIVILACLAPLIYPAFMIIVSLILIIKEWWMNKKEKKALAQLNLNKEVKHGKVK